MLMSDAAVSIVVTGVITLTTMVIGFLTLWIKLRYGVGKVEEVSVKADEAAVKAAEAVVVAKGVEAKIDDNTAKTEAVSGKTTITAFIALEESVKTLTERVDKLEEYTHSTARQLLDSLSDVNLKVTTVLEAVLNQGK